MGYPIDPIARYIEVLILKSLFYSISFVFVQICIVLPSFCCYFESLSLWESARNRIFYAFLYSVSIRECAKTPRVRRCNLCVIDGSDNNMSVMFVSCHVIARLCCISKMFNFYFSVGSQELFL